jgi:hypothetical protein
MLDNRFGSIRASRLPEGGEVVKIRIGEANAVIDVQGETVTLHEVFNGVGVETDQGRFEIAQRDGGIEVLLNGDIVFASVASEDTFRTRLSNELDQRTAQIDEILDGVGVRKVETSPHGFDMGLTALGRVQAAAAELVELRSSIAEAGASVNRVHELLDQAGVPTMHQPARSKTRKGNRLSVVERIERMVATQKDQCTAGSTSASRPTWLKVDLERVEADLDWHRHYVRPPGDPNSPRSIVSVFTELGQLRGGLKRLGEALDAMGVPGSTCTEYNPGAIGTATFVESLLDRMKPGAMSKSVQHAIIAMLCDADVPNVPADNVEGEIMGRIRLLIGQRDFYMRRFDPDAFKQSVADALKALGIRLAKG